MAYDSAGAAGASLHMVGNCAETPTFKSIRVYTLETDRYAFHGMGASCAFCIQDCGYCADHIGFGKTSHPGGGDPGGF